MAQIGISLLPTEAPALNGIPKELLRKQNGLPDNDLPPPNWCGFVDRDPEHILSCVDTQACVYSSTAVGCCDAGLIASCTNFFTTCENYSDECNSACENNNKILKCSNTALPYCGTFDFSVTTSFVAQLYNCDSTAATPRFVDFIQDYYLTAYGRTVQGPVTVTATEQSLEAGINVNVVASETGFGANSGQAQVSSATSAETVTATQTPHHSVSTGVIAGISAGVGVIVLAVAVSLIEFCCLRRRNRRRAALARPNSATGPVQGLSMQQPQQALLGGGQYQPIAQQDEQQELKKSLEYSSYPNEPHSQQGAHGGIHEMAQGDNNINEIGNEGMNPKIELGNGQGIPCELNGQEEAIHEMAGEPLHNK